MLFGPAASCLFRDTLFKQFLQIAFHQCGGQFLIGALIILHRLNEFFPCGRDFINLGRKNILKALLAYIALALHRKGCHAVTGDLRQQRARNALDGEGEGNVLDRTFVTDLGEHIDKILCLFLCQSLEYVVNIA